MSAMLRVKKRILIVDDEVNVCELLSETLKIAGYETFVATSGHEGLEKAVSVKPDLILLDVMMPVLSGWQVLERMRKASEMQDIPVVMLTAKSETESVLRSREFKVLDYFFKPVDMEELIRILPRYVGLRSQREEDTD